MEEDAITIGYPGKGTFKFPSDVAYIRLSRFNAEEDAPVRSRAGFSNESDLMSQMAALLSSQSSPTAVAPQDPQSIVDMMRALVTQPVSSTFEVGNVATWAKAIARGDILGIRNLVAQEIPTFSNSSSGAPPRTPDNRSMD